MKLLKLVNTPTKIHISELAKKNCRIRYGDDLACLMLESVKSAVPANTVKKPKNLLEKLINKISPKKQMSIGVFSNKEGDFFVQSNMKIGNYNFPSGQHRFDFLDTLETLNNFKKVIEQTKDDILKQIELFNKNKRFFKL